MRGAWPGLAALALVLATPLAAAHAVLDSATPEPNGHVEADLTLVELVFTEDVEREYTKADVIDLEGASWAAGPVEFDPVSHNVIRVPLRPLESGLYAVSWQTLSVDSHTARGSYVFAVGTAQLRYSFDTPAHDHAEHTRAQIVKEGFARAAFYAGLFFVVGIPVFALAVMRGEPTRLMLRSAAAFGLVGGVAGLVSLQLFAQRTDLGLATAVGTQAGGLLAWRAGLLLAGALSVLAAAVRPSLARPLSYAAVALGAAALVATAMGSHAAATKDRTALLVIADATHLAMAAVWIGGVVAFLHVLADRGSADLPRLIARFSPVAVLSVALLLGTGAMASVAHVPCLRGEACASALLEEPYVTLVLVKLGLLIPLAAIGAYHKYRVAPSLAQGGPPRAFRRALALEAVLMALVLSAAGLLASTPPPDAVVESAQGGPAALELSNATAKHHVILQIRPNPVTVGVQQVRVVVHPLGGQLANGTTVQLKVWGPGEGEPDTTIELERVAPDEWATEQGLFTRAGTWDVLVLLQSNEFAKLKFQVEVVNPS